MTQSFKPKSEVKTIGSGGQIYLSKKLAGQHVVVTEERPGYWTVKTADVIPKEERWMYTPENQVRLDEALEWAKTHSSQPSTPEELEALFERALQGK